MKAETEKKIYDLMKTISCDVRIDTDVSEHLMSDLEGILVCEAHETKWGKLDVYKYTSTDDLRPIIQGVHYKDGWQVATDSKILLKLKNNTYPTSYEGKTIGKDGKEIEGNYPNYDAVMPLDISGYNEVHIDYDALSDIIKRAKVHKKIYGGNKLTARYLLKVGSQYYVLGLFEKFAKALKKNKINKFFENPQRYFAVFKNENIEILMMSYYIAEDDLERYINDESYFIEEL